MFKKVLALTLALVMLLMPMTASAVTWNTVVSQLRASQVYDKMVYVDFDDGATKASIATGDSETVVIIHGGKIFFEDRGEDGYDCLSAWINSEGDWSDSTSYVFHDIELDTSKDYDYLEIISASDVYVELGENTKLSDFTTVFISALTDGTVSLKNNTDIANSICVYMEDGSKLKVTGNGTIAGYENEDWSEYPISISVFAEDASQEAINKAYEYAKENVSIDLSQVVLNSTEKYGVYVIHYRNSDGEWESIEIEILPEEEEEEEEEEPDPIEELRQAEGIGGVTTSPVWNWQGYLGHSSKPMWIYVNGEKVLMRQRLFWLGDSTKNHTCRINLDEPDPASVELRIGLDMLRTAQRAEISVISILDKEGNPVAQFAVSDLMGAFEQYGLVEGELLCVSGDADAEVMKVTLDGEYLPLEAE